MKKIWNKLFKTQQPYNYTIADYLPVKINSLETQVNVTEYEIDDSLRGDEMDIDHIYEKQ